MKILAAQAWEIKFKNENIVLGISRCIFGVVIWNLGDEFWKSIEPYYLEGKWAYPKGRQVLAELSNDPANKPSLATTPKRNRMNETPKRGTPGQGRTFRHFHNLLIFVW